MRPRIKKSQTSSSTTQIVNRVPEKKKYYFKCWGKLIPIPKERIKNYKAEELVCL